MVDTRVDPDSTEDYPLCTDRLEMIEDVMLLAAAPYSNICEPVKHCNDVIEFGSNSPSFFSIETGKKTS